MQHVAAIQGSADINPAFRITIEHVGMAIAPKLIRANFGHGARNWGATEFHEVSGNETFETELRLKTLDQGEYFASIVGEMMFYFLLTYLLNLVSISMSRY